MQERFEQWLLLTGHRLKIATGILIIMSGIVVIPTITRFTIHNISPLFYICSALIGGNITLITVVVAINQVVLSQELETPGSTREEIERTADYRKQALNQLAPPIEPADFLQQLLQKTQQDAQSLEGLLPDSTTEINDRLLEELPEQCERSSRQVESSTHKLSSVVIPLLGTDYATYIHDCYQLQSAHGKGRTEQFETKLDTLASDLENLVITRQYFTTAFIKEELASLSRLLLYVGVLAVSFPLALLYHLTTYSGASPPMPELYAFTVLTAVVGVVPLALLIAYILRIATVSQHIAVITPFEAQG